MAKYRLRKRPDGRFDLSATIGGRKTLWRVLSETYIHPLDLAATAEIMAEKIATTRKAHR